MRNSVENANPLEACFEIGGCRLCVEGCDNSEGLRLLERFRTTDDACGADAFPPSRSFHVSFDSGASRPFDDGEILSQFQFDEINSRCVFSVKERQYQFVMHDSASGDPLVSMRHQYGDRTVYATQCSDISAFRFALWFAYSLLAAPVHTTFVHSSVVVCQGRAVLFLGESGTGKSTHTRLWLKNIRGARLLNDDSPVLSTVSGRPVVYGSPWSGKTPCYVPLSFPLAAVVRLSQAPRNAMRRLSIPEAFAALQPSLPPALMQDEQYTDLLVDIISGTLSSVPAYHLQCLPDDDAALLSCKTIFGEL